MASGNNIYSKLNKEKKKSLQQPTNWAARETATRHQVLALLDRQYQETANDQKFIKYVSLLAHSENIKITENSNKLKYQSNQRCSKYNLNSSNVCCIYPKIRSKLKFSESKNKFIKFFIIKYSKFKFNEISSYKIKS